jgi:hypothetical protein
MTMQTNSLGMTKSSYACDGEQRVARVLDDAGIRYQYRPKVLLPTSDEHRVWYPSFLVPEYGMYIEVGNQEHDNNPLERDIPDYYGASLLRIEPEALKGDSRTIILNTMHFLLTQRTADLESRIHRVDKKNLCSKEYDFERYYPQCSVMETVYGPGQ